MGNTIRAISLDFDGCLFNDIYKANYARQRVFEGTATKRPIMPDALFDQNVGLFKKLIYSGDKFSKTIILNGSNRQSYKAEMAGMKKNNTESSFLAMSRIGKKLNAEVDPFLTADIYGNQRSGFSYRAALYEKYTGRHADTKPDPSKIATLYAQMHKLANEHPNESVVFEFYSAPDDYVHLTHRYFKDNPQLIPDNVILNMHYYPRKGSLTISTDNNRIPMQPLSDSDTTYSYDPIQGKGGIDIKFGSTVRQIKVTKYIPEPVPGHTFEPKLRVTVPKERTFLQKTVPNQAPNKLSKALDLEDELFKIKWKANALSLAGKPDAAKAALNLHKSLRCALTEFNAKQEPTYTDLQTFQTEALASVQTAHKILDKQVGWRSILEAVSQSIFHTSTNKLSKEIESRITDKVRDASTSLPSPK